MYKRQAEYYFGGQHPGFNYFTNKVVSFGGHRLEPTDTSAEGADLQKARQLWQLSEQLISLT